MTIFKRSSAHQWERKSLFMAEQTKLRRLYTDSTLTPHDQVVNEHCKCTQQGSNEPKKILVSCTQILWSKFTTLQLIAKVVIVISIMYQHNVFKLQSLFFEIGFDVLSPSYFHNNIFYLKFRFSKKAIRRGTHHLELLE